MLTIRNIDFIINNLYFQPSFSCQEHRINTQFRRTIFYLASLTIFFTPLVIDSSVVRMYDIPKAALLKIGVGITSFVWIFWLFFYNQLARLNRLKPILLPLVGLIGIALLSSLLSHPVITSLEGVYERQLGFLGFIACAILMAIVATVTDTKDERRLLIYAILVPIALMAIHGVAAYIGLVKWPKSVIIGGRLAGLLGNSNFIANHLVMGIPLAFLIKDKKILSWSILSAALLATIMTQTRGAYLAIIATITFYFAAKRTRHTGYILLVILFFLSSGLIFSYLKETLFITLVIAASGGLTYFIYRYYHLHSPLKMAFMVITGITLLISLKGIHYSSYHQVHLDPASFGQFLIHTHLENRSALKPNPPENNYPQRITHRFLSAFSFFTTNSRALIWRDTVRFIGNQGIKSILIGNGVENFRRHFMPYKSSEAESKSRNIHFDNPHNSLLYYLSSFGILGSLLLGLFLFQFWKLSKNQTAIRLSLVIYGVSAFSNVDMVASLSAISGILALLIINNSKQDKEKEIKIQYFLPAALLILFFSGWNILSSIKVYRADLTYYKALTQKNPRSALPLFDKALAINPSESQYYQGKAEFMLRFVPKLSSTEQKNRLVGEIERTLAKAIPFSWQPENHYITLYNAKMHIKDINGARRVLENCLRFSPNLESVQKAYYHLRDLKQ